MREVIDFTKMRLGKRTTRTRKIELCPKCGRKGECSRREIVTGRPFRDYTHIAENIGWAIAVRESCSINDWQDA